MAQLIDANEFVPLDELVIKRRRNRLLDQSNPQLFAWKKFKITAHGKVTDHRITALNINSSQIIKRGTIGVSIGSGLRLELLTIISGVVSEKRNCNKFKDLVSSCCSRPIDGSLYAAGDESGMVFAIDPQRALPLKRWKAHNGPVRCMAFLTPTTILTGGDDMALKLWNVATGDLIIEVEDAHGAAITSITPLPDFIDSFLTSSYDGYICRWHVEDNKRIRKDIKLLHGEPIECVVCFKEGTTFASAGGIEVKIWDYSGTGKLLNSYTCHSKTVSSLYIPDDGSFIASGSLDGTVKFVSSDNFEVVRSLTCDTPVTVIGGWYDQESHLHVLTGYLDGTWQIRHRIPLKSESAVEAKKRRIAEDIAVKPASGTRILYSLLKGFRFHESIMRATKISPEIGISFIEMLDEHGVLRLAVRGSSNENIVQLLKFIGKNYGSDPHCTRTLQTFLDCILSENPWLAIEGDTETIKALSVVRKRLKEEVSTHTLLGELSGVVESIIN